MPGVSDRTGTERDLLFGILAVQLGFASPQQVMSCAAAWATDREHGLAERLRAGAGLDEERWRLLVGLVAQSVEVNDGDAAQAIATLGGDDLMLQTFGGSLADVEPPPPAMAEAPKAAEPQTGPSPPAATDSVEDSERVTREHPGRYTLRDPRSGEAAADKDSAELGRGAIGRVLVAFDEHLGREIAVKELLAEIEGSRASGSSGRVPSGATAPMVARFLREGRVTGQLEHPNIVPVYEIGRRDDGVLFYTMKLVRGRALDEALADCHSLTARLRLLPHFVGMCHGMAYAHSRGVVHRDIKPSNVMVGEFGETLVLDWGLAKVQGKRDIGGREIRRDVQLLHEADTAAQTLAGKVLGTPAYMPPEQADGRVEEVDARSDVWSLGAVLYEILTGRPPFSGVTPFEVIGKVITERVAPVRTHEEGAPPDLAAVAEKALRRDPSSRYASAGALAEEVEAFQAGGRVEAYEYSTWELLRRFAVRMRAALVVAGAACVLLCALGAASYLQVLSERDRALGAEQRARTNLAEAFSEKAQAALRSGDRMAAELYAATALTLADRPDARGTMITLGAAWRPKLSWETRRGKRCASVAFSPDGSRLACATLSAAVLFDAGSGAETDHLPMSGSWLTSIAYSPDGELLAAASEDGHVHLWNLADGKHTRLSNHTAPVRDVAFSPDGAKLASISDDRSIRLWDVATATEEAALVDLAGQGRGVAYSPRGDRIAGVGSSELLVLWRPGEEGGVGLGAEEEILRTVAFSPDGRQLVTGGSSRAVRVWRLDPAAELARLRGHDDYVNALAFSRDGAWLASGSLDGGVILRDASNRRETARLIGSRGEIESLAFSADGRQLAVASAGRSVRVWLLSRTEVQTELEIGLGPVLGLDYAPDGGQLAAWIRGTEPKDRRLLVFTRGGGEPRIVAGATSPGVFSPDGRVLAFGTGRDLGLWPAPAGGAGFVVPPGEGLVAHEQDVRRVTFSPDGRTLASGDAGGAVRLWDVESRRLRAATGGHGGAIAALAFSTDGAWLASGGADEEVRVWDAATGRELAVLKGHDATVSAVTFAPRRAVLLSAGHDDVVRVWDTTTWRELEPALRHAQWVQALALAPDGRLLATGGGEKVVRLWDIRTRREVARLTGHPSWIGALAFSPDGRTLAAGNWTGGARLWDLSTLRTPGQALLDKALEDFGVELDGLKVKAHDDATP